MSDEGHRWLYRGACHKFGDNLQHDGQMIAFDYVIRRVTDPAKLIPHLFESVRPDFHKRANRGDVVIAGKQFGKGKAHVQRVYRDEGARGRCRLRVDAV